MIRLLLILFFVKGVLFGCSLCSIYTPKTHVTTQIKADKTHIKTLDINWSFAGEFTKELMQLYDLDLDGKFNEKELKAAGFNANLLRNSICLISLKFSVILGTPFIL